MVDEIGTPASRPQKRTRLPAAERRAQILAVARDLFVAQGFEHASMRRIADAAGITPTSIYDHFEDKEALLTAIAEEFFDGLVAVMEVPVDAADPLKTLRQLMVNYVRYGLDRPNEYRLVFMTTLSRFIPMLGHRNCPFAENGVETPAGRKHAKALQSFGILQTGITQLAAAGLLRADDPEGFADSVWAMGHGIVSLIITKGADNFTPIDRWIDTSIDILLEGMRPR
ncbi:TetR/AcrR family transcriptional regulator [Niveispirillum sp. KHB5.9]|uniref:TetR/AcrR family transcriptional regulator n=1 Tax=Niveispirillum sp. KHB5.9 TaxID=3400269 RepID=UPI003A8700EE